MTTLDNVLKHFRLPSDTGERPLTVGFDDDWNPEVCAEMHNGQDKGLKTSLKNLGLTCHLDEYHNLVISC